MLCEYYNIVLKIYEQNAKDTWNTNRLRKKKILKGWRVQKKEKLVFGNHSSTLNLEMRRRGKKVENIYSNVDFQTFYTFKPLSWHKLYFSLY